MINSGEESLVFQQPVRELGQMGSGPDTVGEDTLATHSGAPRSFSTFTTSWFSASRARASAVLPSLFFAVRSAPALRSTLTFSTSPLLPARNSGVWPS